MPEIAGRTLLDLGDDALLTVGQVAKLLQISESKLNKARSNGNGPTYTKLGRQVRYVVRDVQAWIDANKLSQVAFTEGMNELPEPSVIESWLE